MNMYRITYTSGRGDENHQIITERSEDAAWEAFGAQHQSENVSILHTETLKKDISATKDEEREALTKIREIVAELGPESGVAIAFEGCFSDAESNIESNTEYSMKRRWESAAQQLVSKDGDISFFKSEIARIQNIVNTVMSENQELLVELSGYNISIDALDRISQLVSNRVIEVGKQVADAANTIVDWAETPSSPEFTYAVQVHRDARCRLQELKDLLCKINNARNHIMSKAS